MNDRSECLTYIADTIKHNVSSIPTWRDKSGTPNWPTRSIWLRVSGLDTCIWRCSRVAFRVMIFSCGCRHCCHHTDYCWWCWRSSVILFISLMQYSFATFSLYRSIPFCVFNFAVVTFLHTQIEIPKLKFRFLELICFSVYSQGNSRCSIQFRQSDDPGWYTFRRRGNTRLLAMCLVL